MWLKFSIDLDMKKQLTSKLFLLVLFVVTGNTVNLGLPFNVAEPMIELPANVLCGSNKNRQSSRVPLTSTLLTYLNLLRLLNVSKSEQELPFSLL
jgi:hypothetical protein